MKTGVVIWLLLAGLYGFTRIDKKKPRTPAKVILKFEYDTVSIKPGGDTIVYKPARILSWQDFTAPPPAEGRAVANSAVGFKFSAGIEARGQQDMIITVKACAYFVKSSSWVKRDKATDYILRHEQLHFDIARLGLERFRQQLAASHITRNNYNTALTAAYRRAWQEYMDMQELYDRQTNHSIKKAEQQSWNQQVAAQLQALP